MKKFLVSLFWLVMVILIMSACSEEEVILNDEENAVLTSEVIQVSTETRKPIDILVDAGLSQEKIDMYVHLTNAGVLFSTEDFIKLGSLTDELMWSYVYTYGANYTVDEYIQMINELKGAGLTEGQVIQYKLFKDLYTPVEYVQIIKKMTNAGLTEDQINMYANYHSEYSINPETYISLYVDFKNVYDILYNYRFFLEKLSLEEYCGLITKLRAVIGEESAVPIYPLSDDLVFVKRNISTYDYVEESIAILTLDGKAITDWNVDWGDDDIQYRAECGDYFFIITSATPYDYNCDVVNREGKIISNITCKEKRYDIGEGYVFFSLGADYGQIMNPKGEVIKLQTASVRPSYCDKSMGSLAEGDAIGRISEGLFYGLSIGNNNTVAYYYNTDGEVVIDLSTRAVNFKVTKLYDFSDGQAKIEFTGADYKEYYAFIDKTGAFIGEPTEMAE